MDIIKEINEKWDSGMGYTCKIRKDNVIRQLQVYSNNKWDVWLWGNTELLGRGMVEGPDVSRGFYKEAGTRELCSMIDYLKDFRIVKERSK